MEKIKLTPNSVAAMVGAILDCFNSFLRAFLCVMS